MDVGASAETPCDGNVPLDWPDSGCQFATGLLLVSTPVQSSNPTNDVLRVVATRTIDGSLSTGSIKGVTSRKARPRRNTQSLLLYCVAPLGRYIPILNCSKHVNRLLIDRMVRVHMASACMPTISKSDSQTRKLGVVATHVTEPSEHARRDAGQQRARAS